MNNIYIDRTRIEAWKVSRERKLSGEGVEEGEYSYTGENGKRKHS